MQAIIDNIMTTKIITAESDDSIVNVAEKMKKNKIGFIPVVEGNNLIGVVTDRDLVIRGYAENLKGNTPIKKIMTKKCVTVLKGTAIVEAAEIMAVKKIRRLCIVDGSALVGVCAIGDMAVRENCTAEAGAALKDISSKGKAA